MLIRKNREDRDSESVPLGIGVDALLGMVAAFYSSNFVGRLWHHAFVVGCQGITEPVLSALSV